MTFEPTPEIKKLLKLLNKEEEEYVNKLNVAQKKRYEFQKMIIKADMIYGEGNYVIDKKVVDDEMTISIIPFNHMVRESVEVGGLVDK